MKEFDIKDYIGDISAAEAKSDILEKIKYDKRNLIDNTEGHSFTAPNGWKFKAKSISDGGFGNWPNGQRVVVTDKEKNVIFEFEYNSQSPIYNDIIEPLYKIFYNLLGNEEHRVKMILATDAAEYLYALKNINELK